MKPSKKLLAAIAGALVTALGPQLGLDEATTQQIAAVLVAYIVGQGIADHGKERAKVEARHDG